jgi:phage terminase large subunit GpA-like protein
MHGFADGFRLTVGAAARALRPRERLTIADWAARHRVLPAGKTAEGGPWNPHRIPYLNGIMDALGDDDPAPLVVFVKSSQVGGSEMALNWIGRTIHQSPSSMLALFPSEKDARKWVRTKLNPMLSLTPELRALIPQGRKTAEGNTLQQKDFPGGTLFTGSANIPNDVASVAVAKILLDEVDRMPATLEGEGDPVELAKRRMSTFARRKALEISTPTTDESSRIWADWLASSQAEYFVPCPHCAAFQCLTFDNLKWPDGEPQAAAYQCDECEAMIAERSKSDMLAGGEWRAKFPDREAICKGFHINALYTPVGLGDTWADHAREWERARGKPEKIQVFFNTRRGEIVKSDRVKLEWEALAQRREPYSLRTIPPGMLVLTSGTDIQADRIETTIVGWGRGERSAVVDFTVFYGDPTRPDVWDQVDAHLAKPIANSYNVAMRVAASAIDSGNWQHEVLNFTRTRRGRNIFATKGSSVRSKAAIGKPTLVDLNVRGQRMKRGAEQYQVGVTALKTALYKRLLADEGALLADRHVRFSADLPDEFFRQLAAERFDERHGWVKQYDRNEALDMFVMAMAAALHHTQQVDRLREIDWQRLESLYEPTATRTASQPAANAPRPKAPANRGFDRSDNGFGRDDWVL